jgi:hypothetical protein
MTLGTKRRCPVMPACSYWLKRHGWNEDTWVHFPERGVVIMFPSFWSSFLLRFFLFKVTLPIQRHSSHHRGII